MTIQDREIYGCAKFMLDKHGENAALEASQMADKFHAKGDSGGQRTWQRIIKAIAVLESDASCATKH